MAIANLDRLLQLVDDTNAVGLRLRVDSFASSYPLLERFCDRPHWLILSGWEAESLEKAIASLPHSQFRRLLIEVTDANVLSLNHDIDGLVARGHESGGWIGEDSAFILTQKLLSVQPLPV